MTDKEGEQCRDWLGRNYSCMPYSYTSNSEYCYTNSEDHKTRTPQLVYKQYSDRLAQ